MFQMLTTYLASRLHNDERGATAVEYGLMVFAIAVAIIATVLILGERLDGLFSAVTNELPGGGTTTTD